MITTSERKQGSTKPHRDGGYPFITPGNHLIHSSSTCSHVELQIGLLQNSAAVRHTLFKATRIASTPIPTGSGNYMLKSNLRTSNTLQKGREKDERMCKGVRFLPFSTYNSEIVRK